MAQEIGHTCGRYHAPCGVGDADANYPTYDGYPSGSIGEYGFDMVNGTVFDPATTYDFMSYCDPTWFRRIRMRRSSGTGRPQRRGTQGRRKLYDRSRRHRSPVRPSSFSRSSRPVIAEVDRLDQKAHEKQRDSETQLSRSRGRHRSARALDQLPARPENPSTSSRTTTRITQRLARMYILLARADPVGCCPLARVRIPLHHR